MEFIIKANSLEDLITGASALVKCTDLSKLEEVVAEAPAKAEKPAKKAKKTEAPKEVVAEPTTEAAPSIEPEGVPFEEAETIPMPEPVKEEVKTPEAPNYTLENIRDKVKEYTRSGRKDEMREILKSFGASRSTDLAEKDYAAFMEKCNG